MKQIFPMTLLMGLLTVSQTFAPASQAQASEQVAVVKVAKLAVKGMTCEGCAQTITEKLKTIDGVQNVKIDVKRSKAVVTYDDHKLKPELIVKTINELGYRASL